MPRGVYDRTKAKLKRQQLAGTPTQTPAPAKILSGAVSATSIRAESEIQPLNTHLSLLVQARAGIVGVQHDHNPQLIQTLDQEIISTVQTMKAWREAIFAAYEKKPAAPTAPAFQAPAPTAVAPAPLPFTPNQVQETLRSGSNAAPTTR